MSNHRLFRLLPEWLVSCRADWLRPDIVAGLTTGAVIIPKAMAYAMMAGLPVQVGLYTALVPMVIYAVLGTSRVLSVSTTTTLAILTAAQLGQVVPNGNPAALLRASATLTLLVGAALLLACLLRLGIVANFISEPVLVGFKAGIGLVIVVDQVPDNRWHPGPKRDIRSERPLNRSPFSENVVSNAGRWAHDNRVSSETGTVPAEGPSAAAGCSCCDRGRVLVELAASGCRTGGTRTARTPFADEARPVVDKRSLARSTRDCVDEFH